MRPGIGVIGGLALLTIAFWGEGEVQAIEITTALGLGADTYVNGEGVTYHLGDTNFGSGSTMLLKRSGGDYTRKAYLRFDVSGLRGVHAPDVGLTLTVQNTINQSGGDTTVNVWGLNDRVPGVDNSIPPNGVYTDDEDIHDEFWPEMVIDWFSAPANASDTTMDTTKAPLLGTFTVPKGAPQYTAVTFSHPSLLSLLQNDTNGVITLAMQVAAGDDYIYLYTKEGAAAPYQPKLVLPSAAVSWDAEGGSNKNWSHTLNWSDNQAPIDEARFNNTGTAAAGSVTSIVDEDFTVGTLTFEQTSAAHTVQINNGSTLRVYGAYGVSAANAVFLGNLTTDGTTHTVLTGGGAFVVDSPTKDIWLGGRDYQPSGGTSQSTIRLDMSGLAAFQANLNEIRLATGYLRSKVEMTLAETNTITADAIVVGANTGSPSAGDFLRLGRTNTLQADKIIVAGARDNATLEFNPALSGPRAVTIRGKAGGASRANLWIADQAGEGGYSSGGSSTAVGVINWNGAMVDVRLGALMIGRNGTYASDRPGAATGTLSFNDGTIDATTVVLARTPAVTLKTAPASFTNPNLGHTYGTLNMGGGTLIAGAMILGDVQGHGAPSPTDLTPSTNATGTFNLSGGTAIINGDILLGNHTSTGTATATGTINFSDGVLQAQRIIPGNGVNNVSTFNWTGGTLHVGTFGLNLVQNGGTLAPGTSLGTTHVLGDYTQNAGLLEIEFQSSGGAAGVDFDFLDVTGTATLGGQIWVSLLNGFTPGVGDTYSVLTATDIVLRPGFSAGPADGGWFLVRIVPGLNGEILELQFVPEPSVWCLLLAGLALIGASRIRKREKRQGLA